LVEALNLLAAARKARQHNTTREPVALRPSYPGVNESVAIAAATSASPDAGSVGLSRRPVDGAGGDARAGLG
ncbi:TerC family protein, partial [Mycolicibacter hiberniae]|nr:TerC family protein [Mycolicibacter hiberniae]